MFEFKPQFIGVIEMASNIGTQEGNYTCGMFLQDFPQFFNNANQVSWLPDTILQMFIDQANKVVQPDKWLDQWRYACGLYVAHNATLYLKSFNPNTESAQEAAASGDIIGHVKSATLGDASVTYDTGASDMVTEGWGDLNATTYGQLFANKARLIGLGGSYVL